MGSKRKKRLRMKMLRLAALAMLDGLPTVKQSAAPVRFSKKERRALAIAKREAEQRQGFTSSTISILTKGM